MKRNVSFTFGGDKPDDDDLSNYIDFHDENLDKYYSYFNIPTFGFKTTKQEAGGFKNVRTPTHLLGYILIWIIAKYGGKDKRKKIRRISREAMLKDSRYDVKPPAITKEVAKWRAPPSVKKLMVKLLFCVCCQVRCAIVNLVINECIDYNTGEIFFEQWPIVPNIIDPIMAHYRLATGKKRG